METQEMQRENQREGLDIVVRSKTLFLGWTVLTRKVDLPQIVHDQMRYALHFCEWAAWMSR